MTATPRSAAARWTRVGLTVAAALSTYYLRFVLQVIGLQAMTFVLPVLFAAYFFGSAMALLGSALTLSMAHAIIWQQSPQLLFTRAYFGGIFNFVFISALILLYTYRQEQVLRRLDSSLEREKSARADAEQANRLKDQFLATLSHELRTPVNVMLGYLEMLLSDRTSNVRRALEVVHRNAQQQARLIDDVLDASKITAGTFAMNMEDVRPAAIMRDVLESLQPAMTAKALHMDVAIPDDNVIILADPQRLRQVFWNIVSNAVKFTPGSGRIAVRVAEIDRHAQIVVQDTGRGIAADFLPYVFDMFRQGDASTTREASGMGLGLTLVKRFVELQGGEVRVASAGEGTGTTVTCRFPVRHATQSVAEPAATSSARTLHLTP